MFDRVLSWLESPGENEERHFDDQDIRVAVAALFYHMVAVDGEVTEIESQRLGNLLRERFGLNHSQLAQLSQEGQNVDQDSAGLFPFAIILNREYSEDQRRDILSRLEALAQADGVVHPLEAAMVDQMRLLLKL